MAEKIQKKLKKKNYKRKKMLKNGQRNEKCTFSLAITDWRTGGNWKRSTPMGRGGVGVILSGHIIPTRRKWIMGMK